MYEELVKRLREPCQYENCVLCKESADVIEELSKPQNTVHLCTSCKYQYPECPADTGVVFGRGKGNDNICQCADYVTRIPHWISVTERLPDGIALAVNALRGTCGYHEQLIGYIGKNQESDSGYLCGSEGEVLMNVTHWQPLPEPPKEEA